MRTIQELKNACGAVRKGTRAALFGLGIAAALTLGCAPEEEEAEPVTAPGVTEEPAETEVPEAAVTDPEMTDEETPARIERGTMPAERERVQREREVQRQRQADVEYGRRELSGGLIDVTVTAPEEVRANEPYQIAIEVTNTSDFALANVSVSTIQSGEQREQQTGQQMDEQTPAAARQTQQQPQQQQDQQQQQQMRQSQVQQGQKHMIGNLAPGETKQIMINATASEVGAADVCLAVDYTQAFCATVEVVNPEITLTKLVPEAALICEDIVFTYRVSNVGTGDAENVIVREELPQGLTTMDGDPNVEIEVGTIAAGETEEVNVQLRAERAGEFSGFAVAESETSRAQSSAGSFRIVEPELSVNIFAPEWQALGQEVIYQVSVTNTSDVPAPNTVLNFEAQGLDEAIDPREIGDLDPGQTRSFQVRIDPGTETEMRQLELEARATAYCAQDAVASAMTELRALPALQLEMVDSVDPVQTGQNTIYQITVTNEGFGPATNVSLQATLPQEMTFVEANGPTQVNADGQNLQFGSIQSLEPGQSATWWAEVSAQRGGMTQFQMQMQSDDMRRPAIETEPTRIY